jgi:hypothetical protein
MEGAPTQLTGCVSSLTLPGTPAESRSIVEYACDPLPAGCTRECCQPNGVTVKSNEVESPMSTLSGVTQADSPPHRRLKLQRGQDARLLQAKRRRAQMRLVSLKRGSIKPRLLGEPLCLQRFVADLSASLQQPRGGGGRFTAHETA